MTAPPTPAPPLDAVLAGIDADASAEAAMSMPPWAVNGCMIEGPWLDANGLTREEGGNGPYSDTMIIYDEGGHTEDDAVGIARMRNRMPAYLALARAVVAQRAAHAAIMANFDGGNIPHGDLYRAHDAAHAAVDVALAALAAGEWGG